MKKFMSQGFVSLGFTLADLGRRVAFRFSILPKWLRAITWAFILLTIMAAIMAAIILAVIVLINWMGALAFFLLVVIALALGLIAVSIWNDLPETVEKRKRE